MCIRCNRTMQLLFLVRDDVRIAQSRTLVGRARETYQSTDCALSCPTPRSMPGGLTRPNRGYDAAGAACLRASLYWTQPCSASCPPHWPVSGYPGPTLPGEEMDMSEHARYESTVVGTAILTHGRTGDRVSSWPAAPGRAGLSRVVSMYSQVASQCTVQSTRTRIYVKVGPAGGGRHFTCSSSKPHRYGGVR